MTRTAGELLRAEIGARGPLRFSRFMEIALYHPQCGYYRRGGKIFGREGDFYTAAQMQPVFGRLLSARLEQLHAPAQADGRVLVADWGAGQSDLRESLSGFDYRAVDMGRDEAPERFEGIVLANELFDALPVDVAVREGGVWRERRVACEAAGSSGSPGPELAPEWREYATHAAAEARLSERSGADRTARSRCGRASNRSTGESRAGGSSHSTTGTRGAN